MEIQTLPIDQIDAGGRLRAVDDDQAAVIGASMAQYGQSTPIQVQAQRADGKWPLISGAHRLRGAQLQQMTSIIASVCAVDDQVAEMMEIDENLSRHELNALDRAVFLVRRKEIYEDLFPDTKHGAGRGKQGNDKLVVLIRSFSAETADKLGLSVRSIERAIARARHIAPKVRETIAGTWLSRSGQQLDGLARLTAEEQVAVVEQLLHSDITTVTEALRIVRGAAPARVDVPEADYARLVRVWEKSDTTAQARFRQFIANRSLGRRERAQ